MKKKGYRKRVFGMIVCATLGFFEGAILGWCLGLAGVLLSVPVGILIGVSAYAVFEG